MRTFEVRYRNIEYRECFRVVQADNAVDAIAQVKGNDDQFMGNAYAQEVPATKHELHDYDLLASSNPDSLTPEQRARRSALIARKHFNY